MPAHQQTINMAAMLEGDTLVYGADHFRQPCHEASPMKQASRLRLPEPAVQIGKEIGDVASWLASCLDFPVADVEQRLFFVL